MTSSSRGVQRAAALLAAAEEGSLPLPIVREPALPPGGRVRNAMSVDVEDYFQVLAFAGAVDRDSWDARPCRVERNVDLVLEMFARAGVRATFFTLGWVAERYPAVVRRIVAGGHELASHGYEHALVTSQTPAQFRADVVRTKRVLEDVGGVEVIGYRAATFSIDTRNLWAFDELQAAGYAYDSSLNPIAHDNYGVPDAPRFAFRHRPEGLLEVPMTTVRVAGRNYPAAGGGFFRLQPYALSRWAIRSVNERERRAAVFYFHPWEIDPHQPRVEGAPWKSRLRHYVRLDAMAGKLARLLRDFEWGRMDEVYGVRAAAPVSATAGRAA